MTDTLTPDPAARALLRAMRAADEPARLLLTAREAAVVLAVSEKTLWSLTQPRGSIPSIRLAREA